MRVANRTIYEGIHLQLMTLSEQMKTLNEQISSGRRINRPSDDPLGVTHSLLLKNALSRVEQYGKNIQHGEFWIKTTESALQGLNELVVRGQEIANQMSTGTYNADQRSNSAREVQTLLIQLREIGNTQLNGRYLFSGYREQSQAYDENYHYLGDAQDIEIAIGESVQMKINLTGEVIFGPEGDPNSNVFQIFADLRDALQSNDVHGVQAGLERLKTAQTRINSNLADVGSRLNRLENSKGLLSGFEENHTERLADIEDTDVVKAMTDLSAKQSAYQAALYSTAQITQLSLINFLR